MILIYFLAVFVFFVAFAIFCIFFILETIALFTTNAPFVPIPKGIDQKILGALKLDGNSIFYDLGCGDGRVLQSAVTKNPYIKAVGVEKSFLPYFLAKFNTRKYKNIKIIRGDIFKTDISNATHIFLYLYPEVVEGLMKIFDEKCKNGTRIVSCDFEDKNRRPDEIITLENNKTGRGNRLVVYTINK